MPPTRVLAYSDDCPWAGRLPVEAMLREATATLTGGHSMVGATMVARYKGAKGIRVFCLHFSRLLSGLRACDYVGIARWERGGANGIHDLRQVIATTSDVPRS
ncbi:hypothetical protein B296_00054190 [Ensete ventricosum]|uniref:Uncharacterized protein n=1 Tax=Ensete ventricosum TaxID=4639 RepID=A0A426X295_ENSVE|nr:hypothetical protein B296_00054190 [Ensete ventricosum]